MLELLHNHAPLLLLIGALAVAVHLVRAGQAPLLVDVLFVGLLLARPSAPAALLLLVQYGARRVPFVAGGMAALWGRPIPAMLLPGAPLAPVVRPVAAAEPATVPRPVRPLPSREWLHRVNQDATAPHLAITGPTRAGKTTLALAALGNRPGQVVVCTPKPASKDPWGGAPAVRLGEERGDITYAPLANAVEQVYKEMLRRNREDATGEPISLILDDYSTLVAERPEVRPQVLRLWTMAASCGIRVVIIDTEESVKAWGIEGRGDARSNLVFMRVSPDRSAAIYRWREAPAPINTGEVMHLARHARLDARAWPGLSVWSAPAPPVLPLPDATDRPQTDRQTTDEGVIELLIAQNYTREKAREWLATRGLGLDNNVWSKVAARVKAQTPGG